jgi:hypothetical protein
VLETQWTTGNTYGSEFVTYGMGRLPNGHRRASLTQIKTSFHS